MSTNETGLEQFEEALAAQSQQACVLSLYVSGATHKSLAAIKNVKNICVASLAGRYRLEVVDIFQQPDRAVLDQVVAVPMLEKQLPLPVRRLIGTLSNSQKLLQALGVMDTQADLAKGTG
jgi:circadian clock protein KaiB